MTTVLSSKGQIVIPAEIRARHFLKSGDKLEIEETDDGILLKQAKQIKAKPVEKRGLLVLRTAANSPVITNAMSKVLKASMVRKITAISRIGATNGSVIRKNV